VPAVLLPAALRVRGAVACVVAGLVVAAAEIVAIATALSPGDHLRLRWMLGGEALVAIAAAAIWHLTGRRPIPRPPRPERRWLSAHPIVAALGLVTGLAMAVQAFQALSVVSPGWDANAYHLSRAAYWLQYHSVGYFPGGTTRELGNPPNGEILQAWTMMVAGGEALVNLVQWVAAWGIGLAVYLGARRLEFPRAAAAFAGLLTMTLPTVIVGAASANNDLVAGFFVIAAAVFGVRALQDRHPGEAAVAAAALALAVGTKGIVVIAGPSLLILWLAVAVTSRTPLRVPATYAAFVVAAFGVLAAPYFAENLHQTGALYGDSMEGAGGVKRTSPILSNSLWMDWSYLEIPGAGIDWLDVAAVNIGNRLQEPPSGFSYAFRHGVDDSRSAFGPVLPFLLAPLLLFELFRRRRRRARPPRRLVAGVALLYLVLFPVLIEYDPDKMRLALPGVVLGAPLLATIASRRWAAGAVAAIAAVVLVACVARNPLKPLLVEPGQTPAYRMTRGQQLSMNRPDIAGVIAGVDDLVGRKVPIAFVGGWDAFDYPFFGPHLDRRVIRLDSPSELTIANMKRLGVPAAVLCNVPPPKGLRTFKLNTGWTLVTAERRPA
jgi:hypothetical protein